jgi:purine-binding chemotaxis protein CheW
MMETVTSASEKSRKNRRKRRGTGSVVRKILARGKSGNSVQVVEFKIGKEIFAFDLFDIREVIAGEDITPIPESPPYIKGIIDLRGAITTIIDLKEILHITTDEEVAKNPRIIVLDQVIMGKKIGILVQDVFSVSTYGSDEIERGEQTTDQKIGDVMIGVIRQHQIEDETKEKLILWLNIKKIVENIKQNL